LNVLVAINYSHLTALKLLPVCFLSIGNFNVAVGQGTNNRDSRFFVVADKQGRAANASNSIRCADARFSLPRWNHEQRCTIVQPKFPRPWNETEDCHFANSGQRSIVEAQISAGSTGSRERIVWIHRVPHLG
jgi:hypothetical protein